MAWPGVSRPCWAGTGLPASRGPEAPGPCLGGGLVPSLCRRRHFSLKTTSAEKGADRGAQRPHLSCGKQASLQHKRGAQAEKQQLQSESGVGRAPRTDSSRFRVARLSASLRPPLSVSDTLSTPHGLTSCPWLCAGCFWWLFLCVSLCCSLPVSPSFCLISPLSPSSLCASLPACPCVLPPTALSNPNPLLSLSFRPPVLLCMCLSVSGLPSVPQQYLTDPRIPGCRVCRPPADLGLRGAGSSRFNLEVT